MAMMHSHCVLMLTTPRSGLKIILRLQAKLLGLGLYYAIAKFRLPGRTGVDYNGCCMITDRTVDIERRKGFKFFNYNGSDSSSDSETDAEYLVPVTTYQSAGIYGALRKR